jgi:hypothetical protein
MVESSVDWMAGRLVEQKAYQMVDLLVVLSVDQTADQWVAL